MKRGEIETALSRTNPWWHAETLTRPWTEEDRDLRDAADAPFDYCPEPLGKLRDGALYVLTGPRRVGKSVELKRLVQRLLDGGVPARRILHAACDDWRAGDLNTLVAIADELSKPSRSRPRYLLLDEVTAVRGDWASRIKWLRDNTSMRDDVVVLTGSSAEQLAKTQKLLAGRRGSEPESERTLLPMGFKSFCRATGVALPETPCIAAKDMLRPGADEAIDSLRVYMDQIVPAWERYLQVGGFPRAVRDWVRDREVSAAFVEDLWGVIHGDALTSEDWTELQSRQLLSRIAAGLGSPFTVERAARDAGEVHHETIRRRLRRLRYTYVTWPCPRGDGRRVKLGSREKLYFVDPLQARLVALHAANGTPDFTQLTEQQLGMALLRQHESRHPGRFAAFDALMYQRTATGEEIDFVGPSLAGVPYEGKYTEGAWLRAAQTASARYSGKVVLATRNVVERRDEARAIPAGMLALLLDPAPPQGQPGHYLGQA